MKVRSLQAITALVLVLALAVPSVFASPAGEQVWQTQSILADGLTYTDTVSIHPSYGREELYSLTLTPGSFVKPIVLTGETTVYGGDTMTGVLNRAKSMGYHVLGAVNADFFSTATRVPLGIVIEDGIYKSSPEGRSAIAFRADGSAFLSTPEITLTLTNQGGSAQAYNAGQTISLTHLNKQRSDNGLYLFSEYYSILSTRAATSGWVARLKVLDGTLTLNSAVTLEVEDVFLTDGETYPHAQPIGEGYYLLTAAEVSGLGAEFSKLAVGDRLTLSASCNDEAMSQALWSCGGGDILVQDGAVTDSASWDSSISASRHPRTLLGIRADGTVQLSVADGRKSAHSNGLSLTTAAQELLEQGCVTVINLDGGGSSVMSVQLPGDHSASVVNSPSDGSLRRCGTYILFVSSQPASGTPSRLYLAQNGAVVFQGASIDLSGFYAADSAAYPAQLPADVVLSTAGAHGTLNGTVYTAGSAGVETITLTSPSTGVTGTAQLYVVDTLSSLTVTQGDGSGAVTTLSPEPGEAIQLDITGQWNGLPVTLHAGLADWSATGNVGTVTEDGLFTAGHTSKATGSVTASCGGQSSSVSLSLPISFLDVDDSWAKSFIMNLANQGIVGGVNTEAGTMYYPGQNITRQEFFIMLCNILKVDPTAYTDTELPFADADQIPSWSLNYIKAMYALGYTSGSLGADGQLYSNYGRDISRAEIAVLLGQFLSLREDFESTAFTDQDQIPQWALPGLLTAVSNGLMGGDPQGNIHAANPATRAEVAVILSNFLPLAAETQSQTQTEPQT